MKKNNKGKAKSKTNANTVLNEVGGAVGMLEQLCSPYQKTFEPDGADLYIKANVIRMMELFAFEFADWINRNGYEPMAIFPLKDNKKWSCDDGESTKTTKQLYEEYRSQTAAAVTANFI